MLIMWVNFKTQLFHKLKCIKLIHNAVCFGSTIENAKKSSSRLQLSLDLIAEEPPAALRGFLKGSSPFFVSLYYDVQKHPTHILRPELDINVFLDEFRDRFYRFYIRRDVFANFTITFWSPLELKYRFYI